MRTMLARLPLVGRFFAADPVLVARLRTVIASRRGRTIDTTDAHEAWLADLARKLRVPTDEVDFLVSAIGAYQRRATVLRGLAVSYDADFERVFRALDHLAAEEHGP